MYSLSIKHWLTLVFFIALILEGTCQAQRFNIMDFGGDPNGLKDNSKLINSLVDSLSKSGGGEIFVPNGSYLINDAIILKSNIHLLGESSEKTKFFRDPNQGFWKNTKSQALITTDPSSLNTKVKVSNIYVDGAFNKNEENAKGGICLRNCQDSSVSNVTTIHTWHGIAFYGFKGEQSNNLIHQSQSIKAQAFTTNNNSGRPRGILVTDSGSKVIQSTSIHAGTGFYANGKDITFENCKAENWFTDNGYYLIVDNLIVRKCSAIGGPNPKEGFGSGFAIAYKKNGLVEESEAINCSNYGFRIHVPQSHTKFISNKAIGCGIGFGIETASHPFPEVSDNIQLFNNISEESGLNSFLFRQMTNSVISGNQAINGNQRGVTLSTRGAFALKDYVSNSTFTNNSCEDNQNKKTQVYGFYDYSVDQIKSAAKKGKNNKISHNSKNGKDVY